MEKMDREHATDSLSVSQKCTCTMRVNGLHITVYVQLCENMASFTKAEVHNIALSSKEERPWSHEKCRKHFVKFALRFLRYARGTQIHTYIQTDRPTR